MFDLPDGNGFKTSTMRLGADVIVFSRCSGKEGKRWVFILCIVLFFLVAFPVMHVNIRFLLLR